MKWLVVDIFWTTIAGNEADSPAVVNNAQGGGIFLNIEPIRLKFNSKIIATNTADGDPQSIRPNEFVFTGEGYNIFDDYPEAADDDLDQVGVEDPGLEALGAYGGPTQTMRPVLNGPANDMGAPDGNPKDQRGFDRPVGVATDVGAVECYATNDCLFEGFGPPPIPPPPGGPGADGFGGFGEFVFFSSSLGDASAANQLPARATTLEVQVLPAATTAFFVDSARNGSSGPLFYWNDPLRSSMTAIEFALLGEIE